jgi:hypothetical protein
MSVTKKMVLVVAAMLVVAMTATPANNAEQVVFSDTGAILTLTGNQSGLATTPFGFWIWCAGSAASGSNGGYQNAGACQGSMYFYALQTKASSVVGDVSEGPDGIYTMHVVQGTAAQFFSGTLNPSFTCTLNNTTPNPTGPANTVKVGCIFIGLGGGTGKATDTGAVVNITGPN